ncbi:MAG: hydrogenase maturation protease [Thermoanaerobaculia bacterium]
MKPETLILGLGNPGRGDDGLGPEFVRTISDRGLRGVATDSDYQLQVENAAEVARFRRVLFVDADRTGAEPFWLGRVQPRVGSLAFSTHSVSPAAVLGLARDLFQAEPEAWILGIRGYEFDEFEERLSDRAQENLEEAVRAIESAMQSDNLQAIRNGMASPDAEPEHEDGKCQTTNP